MPTTIKKEVTLPVQGVDLEGTLTIPPDAAGLIIFAHGSGSSRHSPRNRFVAGTLNERGFATLLLDLMTRDEEAIDEHTHRLRFDIAFLAQRLEGATEWAATEAVLAELPFGFFGASTGAAAALVAAAAQPDLIQAVVSRGGRPDLATPALDKVKAATLLIVGGADAAVIPLNEFAYHKLVAPKEMVIVDRATHLFEEPGALEEVARLAGDWFKRHLATAAMSR